MAACVLSDGVSATVLSGAETPNRGRVALVDSETSLLPETTHLASHTADASGFRVVLHPLLAETIEIPVKEAIDVLLERNRVKKDAVIGWCLHPGGSRILKALQKQLQLTDAQMEFSRKSLRDHGNSGSVSVLNVLGLALQDLRTPGYIVMAAVGPGITPETALLHVNP